jgi:chemotaxis family two-component system response regulator PixH
MTTPLVLKLTRAILERENIAVVTAASWIEFNHVLNNTSPDLLFIDVNLPSVKGNTLTSALKEHATTNRIPIILISDLPKEALTRLIAESGADAWLRKPLTREKLLDVIARHTNRSSL